MRATAAAPRHTALAGSRDGSSAADVTLVSLSHFLSLSLCFVAAQVKGTATLVQETGQHPGVLKDAVASPGGTTIAGLHALENAGFRGALMTAVVAAAKRATELANQPSPSAPAEARMRSP